jgi:hypothetical protein
MEEDLVSQAVEMMKELDSEAVQPSTPKIMMSIETYEQMIADPTIAEDISKRILEPKQDPLLGVKDFLMKW